MRFPWQHHQYSGKDLIRFAHYDLRISLKHRIHIHTGVLSPAYSKRYSSVTVDSGCLRYSVRHLVIVTRNADEEPERIQTDIESGKPVHEFELVWGYGDLPNLRVKGFLV